MTSPDKPNTKISIQGPALAMLVASKPEADSLTKHLNRLLTTALRQRGLI